MAVDNGLKYSDNDLLDLELEYGRSVVKDQKVLDLIAHVKYLHAGLKEVSDAVEAVRSVANDLDEKLGEFEDGNLELTTDLDGLTDKEKAALDKELVKPLRAHLTTLCEKVSTLEEIEI